MPRVIFTFRWRRPWRVAFLVSCAFGGRQWRGPVAWWYLNVAAVKKLVVELLAVESAT